MLDISAYMWIMPPRITTVADPQKVGNAIAKRREQLHLGQDDIPTVSRSVLSLIETAKQDSFQERKLAAVGRALKWRDDWLERIEAGLDPVIQDDDASTPESVLTLEQLEARISARFDVQADRLRELTAATNTVVMEMRVLSDAVVELSKAKATPAKA